jgi:hypothetical protein
VLFRSPAPAPAGPHRCAGDADPQTIEQAVAWMAALPPPVDAPCLVAGLRRPLRVEATTGPFSAQPADGEASPRLFFSTGGLRLSLVGSGPGAGVVELGELVDGAHSRKAELPLPVAPGATAQDAFDQIAHPVYGTGCAVCHIDTWDDPRGGQVSIAIRPTPGTEVGIDALSALADGCAQAGAAADARCALITEVVSGEVRPDPSPAAWPTLFEL